MENEAEWLGELTRQIIFINRQIIKESGGTIGMENDGTIYYALYKANNALKHGDVYRSAALLLKLIATKHPFTDGNKRTAIGAAERWLSEAGYVLSLEYNEGSMKFLLDVASDRLTVKEIVDYMSAFIKKKNI